MLKKTTISSSHLGLWLMCTFTFYLPFEVVITFESVDEISSCYHSNSSPSPVFLHGIISFSPFYNLMAFGIAVEFYFGRFWQREGLDQQKLIKIT